jgi:trehalose-6-phosphate synthase
MRDLVIVSNRGPFAFSESFISQARESLRIHAPPVSPKFGEGGLVQAMAGLLKSGRWKPIWIGASLGDKDIDVAYGHHTELFEAMHERGYAPDRFPHIVLEPNKRIHFRYREYDFYMRLVFFDAEHMHSYYTTFANGFLWPLMHLTRSPLLYKTKERVFPRPVFRKNDYLQYTSSGVTFAHIVFDETKKSQPLWRKGDQFIVWNQDYHLMQVAECYKGLLHMEGLTQKERHRIHVGQFMHTPFFNIHEIQGLIREDKRRRKRTYRFDPFPESMESVLQKLTWGMLANDFVGFHHKEYCDNYLEALQEWFPRYHVTIRQREQFYEVSHPNGVTTLGVFPIGLDVHKILDAVKDDRTLEYQHEAEDLYEMIRNDRKSGRLIFGGLERCDYTKGLIARLEIFASALRRLRQVKGKRMDARLYQVTSPSRSDSPDYRNLESLLKEQVRVKNEGLGHDVEPIVHLGRGVPPPQNYRFMKEIDVMLVTPLEDGMNLVALEYILSQKHRRKRGLLVLGNCGAARVLRGSGFKEEDGVVYVDPSKEEHAGERIVELLLRGASLSGRLIDHVEREFRVDEWARKNIEAIVSSRKRT